jgi:uncharacterized protein (TIGR00369 family)
MHSALAVNSTVNGQLPAGFSLRAPDMLLSGGARENQFALSRRTFMAESPFGEMDMPPCAKLLGWRLLAHNADEGWARIEFQGRPEFLNPAGFIQGGILAAMLDDCMGPAAWFKSKGEYFTATIDMNVSYLAAAKPGRLIGEGRVVQLGKTVGFLEAKLTDESGQLIARATSSARLVPGKRISAKRDEA